MIQLNTGLNCDFTHGKHLLRVMRHSFDSPTLIMTSNSPPAPGYFFRQENDLKWSVRSAWEMYTGHCVAWALLSLHVFVFACVCACLSVDSGALMLKDVSSFLQCTGLLQQPCWAALMSRMCHCRTFSSEITARGDQNGMFILSIPPPSFYFCITFFLSLILLAVGVIYTGNFNIQFVYRNVPWSEKASVVLWRCTAFRLEGVTILSQHLILCVFPLTLHGPIGLTVAAAGRQHFKLDINH